jgi:hypothetical protein
VGGYRHSLADLPPAKGPGTHGTLQGAGWAT